MQSEYMDVCRFPHILRILVIIYGPALPHESLRHAVLGLVTLNLPEEQFGEKAKYHQEKAENAVWLKQQNPGLLKDVDVFDSFIMSLFASENGTRVQFLRRAKESLEILQDVIRNSIIPSDAMLAFGPYVRYALESLRTAISFGVLPRVPVDGVPTTLSHRLQYREEFRRISSSKLEPLDEFGVAVCVREALQDLCTVLLRRLFGACMLEVTADDDRQSFIEDVLNYIDEELGDPQLQRALKATAQPIEAGRVIHGSYMENFLQTIHLSTIDLLISVFEAPSIKDGLNSAEAKQKAARIVNSIQKLSQYTLEETEEPVHFENRECVELWLLSSSLALSHDEESFERESPVYPFDVVQLFANSR